ncbi:hypothetical protein BV22DRAFT_1076546 [Leucogyrophana mollusca]|uniref:Uncharacterized protein n=1 Tax=Leucogyrophana mollusca TaxID=85980 RepID=A0ACB8AYK9_9AGAM|nr:hypothetical protein BV22DRAFT_1076546 [Leucogyrophana mollusca]
MDFDYENPDLEAFEDEDDCDDECDCPGCLFSDNASDTTPEPLSDSEDEQELHDPIQWEQTRRMKARLEGQDLASKVLSVLDTMHAEGMNVPIFMEALCYGGDAACRSNDRIRYARTCFLMSEQLPCMLPDWHKPPRNHNKGRRPAGARRALEEFAVNCTTSMIDREMEHLAPHFLSSPDELSQEHLTCFDFNDFTDLLKREAPVLWSLLDRIAYTDKQRARNTCKGPDMVILHLISQAQYTRSNRGGRITKLWAIYLKACGLSAHAFDALHALGIVMSHKWTANAYGELSRRAMDEVRREVQHSPWVISHDNVNIPMRVFSQRLHNQSHFTSGCAATVWVLPQDALLPTTANQEFRSFRSIRCTERFSYCDIQDFDPIVHSRIKKQHIFHVLRILLDSPEFADYSHSDNELFKPPPPVDQLPCGPDNIVKQYMLGTTDIEEASYEGNDKVMAELFRQMALNSEEEMKKTGAERVIPWIGDQMTVERLRGLIRYRHEDFNAFDRMDYVIPIFGWFHLQMALANSLHKQYLGTSAGIGGLQQAFDILKRKGLQKAETKGPFWHHLDEALHHIDEAHLRASWLVVGKVVSLDQLKTKSPRELLALAVRLIDEHASRKAVTRMMHVPDKDRDQVQAQFTRWNADVFVYIELTAAMKVGCKGLLPF